MSELFEIGTVKIDAKGAAVLAEAGQSDQVYLGRHASGDYGIADQELRQRNEKAIKAGGRIQSIYELPNATIWVVTEGQPPVTTISAPDNKTT